MSELSYWVWLSMKSAVRPETRRALLAHCDGPRMLFFARRDDLRGLGVRLRPSEERALLDKDMDAADRALEICEREGVSLITLRDAGYPERLRRLADAPCVLYVRGRLPRIDDHPAVAVAGTRRASQYGLRTAKRFGADTMIHPGRTDAVREVLALTEGVGCDVYIEATGHPSAVQQGLDLIRKGGTFVEFSVMSGPSTIDWSIIGDAKEITIRGSQLSPHCYPSVIEGFDKKQYSAEGVVSHRFALTDWAKAFETAHSRDAVKVVLVP